MSSPNRMQQMEWDEYLDTTNGKDLSTLVPIVYSKNYAVKFCGLQKLHPFDAAKGEHVLKFLIDGNVIKGDNYMQPLEARKIDLQKVHTKKYLKSLKWSINAAKISEIPFLIFVPNVIVQRCYLKKMRYQTGGSILASKLALQNGWSINLGGGFHHCSSSNGGGFCAYADISLIVHKLVVEERQLNKVMIVDLDAHQGNGHERDFLKNKNVFIFDMYNAFIYPRDHIAKNGIDVAVELKPHTNDESYLAKLRKFLDLSLTKFQPDMIVYNAGTDVLLGDPLGMLDITVNGVIDRDEIVFRKALQLKIPIVMLLSGGYLRSSAKVIADSILNLQSKGLLNGFDRKLFQTL